MMVLDVQELGYTLCDPEIASTTPAHFALLNGPQKASKLFFK